MIQNDPKNVPKNQWNLFVIIVVYASNYIIGTLEHQKTKQIIKSI